MILLLPILAESENGTFKIVLGVVFALIWIISAIASASKKKPQQEQQRSWEEVVNDLGRMGHPQGQAPPPSTLPNRPQPIAQAPMPRPLPPKQQAPRPTQPKKRAQQRRVQPPPQQRRKIQPLAAPVIEVAEAGVHILRQQEADRRLATGDAGAKVSSPAQKISRWFNPGNLKSAMILREVLDKPLALRGE